MRRRALALAALALLVAPACTSDPEPSAIRQTPGAVEGEFVSRDDALPPEFPSDFPLPAERTVIYSAVGPYGSVAYFDSGEPLDRIKEAILDGLERDGWRLHSCLVSGGADPVTTIGASSGGTTATVIVGYSEPAAAPLRPGERFALMVSVTTSGEPPVGSAERC